MPKITAKPTMKYPELEVHCRDCFTKSGPITYEEMKGWLGYESEEEYRARTGYDGEFSEHGLNASIVHDRDDRRWILHNNVGNRDFRLEDCLTLKQEILQRKWAGPTNFPGETVNGETIILSRTGRCISIQHRGVAFLWAVEEWRDDPKAHPQWPTEPVLESLVVFGVSDRPEIVQTIDNTRTRSDADMLYTTDVFAEKGLDIADRKELNRKLAAAIDLVWKRTRGKDEDGCEYRTHSVTSEFLNRHARLKDCVKLVFSLDSGENGRPFSFGLRMSAGDVAGLMYLFASCKTDLDKYVGPKRSERRMDLTSWKKAEKFITLLTKKGDELDAVNETIAGLKDAEEGLGGRQTEKHAVLIKAWNVYKTGGKVTLDDLKLEYGTSPNSGESILIDWPRAGGIDQGDPRGDKERPPTRDEIEEQKRKAQDEKAKAGAAKIKPKVNAKPKKIPEMLADLREKYPKRLFLWANGDGWDAWDDDARKVSIDLDLKAVQNGATGWVLRCTIPEDDFDISVATLASTNKVALVGVDADGDVIVKDYQPKRRKK